MVTGLRQRPLTPDLLLIGIHPSPPSLNKKSKTFSRYSSLADRNADPVNLTAGLAPPARFPNDEPDRACGTEPDLKEFPRGGLPAFPFIERALPALGAYEYTATGGDVADAGIGELGDVPFSKSPDFLSGLSEDCGESVYDGVHEDLPYGIDIAHVSWEDFRNGDARIEQNILVDTASQRKIVVGKSGEVVGRIGINARAMLERALNRKVHLILNVRLKKKKKNYRSDDVVFAEQY